MKIARRCNWGRKPGTTVVEIMIKPEGKLEHFKLVEKIPKGYIDDLDEYIKSMEGNYTYFKIKSDPLIMWHFNEISEETIIRYTVDKEIFEYCADIFKTVGLAVNMSSEGVASEAELDVIKNDSLEFNLSDTVEIGKGSSNDDVFKEPLWNFVSSSNMHITKKMMKREKGKRKEVFKDYHYKISKDDIEYKPIDEWVSYNPTANVNDFIRCLINATNKKVKCEVGSGFSGALPTFYVKVTDPDNLTDPLYTAESNFTVTPFDCSGKTQTKCESSQYSSNCGWCKECKGKKYSGDVARCVNKGTCDSFYTCDLSHCGAECSGDGDCLFKQNNCTGNDYYNYSKCNGYCEDCGCKDKKTTCISSDLTIKPNADECAKLKLRCYADILGSCSEVGGHCRKGLFNPIDDCDFEFGNNKDTPWYAYDDTTSHCDLWKERCKCRYDGWTGCGIGPKCPPHTSEIERKPCCIDNSDCEPGKVCQAGSCVTTCSDDCTPSGKKECSGANAYKECGNYDADACLEWSSVTNCASGQVCQAGSCVDAMASLSATQKNFHYGGITSSSPPSGCGVGGNIWYYNPVLKALNGDINITGREKCSKVISTGWSFGCGIIKSDIKDWFGATYIPSGSQISATNFYICYVKGPPIYTYTVNETFYGKDQYGNLVQYSNTFSVNS